MSAASLAQPGTINSTTAFAEYLTFVVRDADVTRECVEAALTMVDNATKSIRQKDPNGILSTTVGFSARAWPLLFPQSPAPEGLETFPELRDGDRYFPSTPGDIFVMVKAEEISYVFQAAKYLLQGFAPLADCTEDVIGFRYLDDRDPIDFVDGTENPIHEERVDAVLVPDGPYAGGSHLIIQQYIDRSAAWNAQSTEDQEGVIGRSKLDNIEIADDRKKPYAHNVKSKVEIDGEEIDMYRQNRAFGTATEHGTMFVGFAKAAGTIYTSLRQMIIADSEGHYDHLLDFVDARTGAAYFVPPQGFLDELTD